MAQKSLRGDSFCHCEAGKASRSNLGGGKVIATHFFRKYGKMKKLRLNSQVRKAFQGRSRGFTLIEIVIAIALLGVVAIAILSSLSTASIALIIADKRATAESLARSQLEFVKNQPYNPAPNGGEATYPEISGIPDGYTIGSVNRDDEIVEDVIGIPWDSGNNTALYEDNGLQRIKVIVSRDSEVVITMENYKRNPEI